MAARSDIEICNGEKHLVRFLNFSKGPVPVLLFQKLAVFIPQIIVPDAVLMRFLR